jgi:protein CLEC16A
MSFWANLFSSSKDRFSLDEMQRLHTVLLRNQVVTDGNRETVVETLRSIAELTIWGDQHDPSMVEYFLTENMLGHFHQILLQRSARRGTVAIQVLQVRNILNFPRPRHRLSLFLFLPLIYTIILNILD